MFIIFKYLFTASTVRGRAQHRSLARRLNIAMLIASNVFINIMSTWKLIQRRCYDLLSYKYSLLVILVAFTCIFIGIVHFGEVRRLFSLCMLFNIKKSNVQQRIFIFQIIDFSIGMFRSTYIYIYIIKIIFYTLEYLTSFIDRL